MSENYRIFLQELISCELECKSFEIFENPRRPTLMCREVYATQNLWSEVENQSFLEVIPYEIQNFLEENFLDKKRKLPLLVPPLKLRQKFIFLNNKKNPFRSEEVIKTMSLHGIDLSMQTKNRYQGIEYTVELKTKPQLMPVNQFDEVKKSLEEFSQYLVFRLKKPNTFLEKLSLKKLELIFIIIFFVMIILRLLQIYLTA